MKNIILIILDSVRRDYFTEKSKNKIPELESDFIEYKDCYSLYTTTGESFYTIIYGDYFGKAKCQNFPSQLKNFGFKTRSFCNGAIISPYPLRGEPTEENNSIASRAEVISDLGIDPVYNWKKNSFGKRVEDYYGAADDNIRDIPRMWKDYLYDNKEEKNFIFLHFWDTHHNYGINRDIGCNIEGETYRELGTKLIEKLLKKELTIKTVQKSYLKRIYESLNIYIRNLIDLLKKYKMYDDSLIILVADHGEGLGDIGNYCTRRFYKFYKFLMNFYRKIRQKVTFLPHQEKFFCWKWDFTAFYHAGNHNLQKEIPLFVKFPNNIFGGTKYPNKVLLFDIIHTINDLIGNKLIIDNSNGCSLFSLLKEDGLREKSKIKKSIETIIFSKIFKNI